MKIGILQTGRSPDEIRGKNRDYNDLFERLLADRGFEFTCYPVLENIFPDTIDSQEGWLVTGSKFGAYEDHDWIPPLEDLLRDIYAKGSPLIGVCFGHQIIAQALGGTVEKFSGGWSVGAVDYDLKKTDGSYKKSTLMAWHQDQVTKLPEDAEVIGSSSFCKYAMLSYGNRALTIQPHPEFDTDFFKDLFSVKSDILPQKVAEQAAANQDASLSQSSIADIFEAFYKRKKITQ